MSSYAIEALQNAAHRAEHHEEQDHLLEIEILCPTTTGIRFRVTRRLSKIGVRFCFYFLEYNELLKLPDPSPTLVAEIDRMVEQVQG